MIALPAKFESDALVAAPLDFVRVLEAPGAVHVERRVGQELIVGMFNAIWPMIITVLLSSGFAAVIIWLLVSIYTFSSKSSLLSCHYWPSYTRRCTTVLQV